MQVELSKYLQADETEDRKGYTNGYKVTFSQANTKYDAKENYVAGTFINQNTTTKFVPDDAKGISNIYDN